MAGETTDDRGGLRELFEAGTCTGMTDGELLERFASRRPGAEPAFAALVERHGPMVFRACRAVLRDDHAAMDAFQAAFLALARKAGSLWVRDSIGPWLHRVARRAAVRARAAAARRREGEREAAESGRRDGPADDREGLAALLHEEVDRLPERWRAAIVLCHLEGLTCEQAARRLDCPVGTVASRLARGRRRLRERLERRGVCPAAARESRAPLPVGLAGSTAAAAMRLVSTGSASRRVAASLVPEVLDIMARSARSKVAAFLVVATASTCGLAALGFLYVAFSHARPPLQGTRDDFAEARKQPIRVVVDAPGRLEASRTFDLACGVEGPTAILTLVPEGTRVSKGDVVCELDAGAVRDRLVERRRGVRRAESALEVASLERAAVEAARKEYEEATYPRERQLGEGEAELAREALARAEERRARLRAAREAAGDAGGPAALDLDERLEALEEAIARRRLEREAGVARLEGLEKYARPRELATLQVRLVKAAADESAAREALELERAEEGRLARQVDACRILAPADGIATHADGPARGGARLEEGAVVVKGQPLLTVVDLDAPMRLVAFAPESMVDQLAPGQTARVRIDSLGGEEFAAVVDSVAPLPDPGRAAGASKVYPTVLSLREGGPGLRPGMSAQAEILVAALDDVLAVPAAAVRPRRGDRPRGRGRVLVTTPGGGHAWREVTLGRSDGRMVEVKGGLEPGETVFLKHFPPDVP